MSLYETIETVSNFAACFFVACCILTIVMACRDLNDKEQKVRIMNFTTEDVCERCGQFGLLIRFHPDQIEHHVWICDDCDQELQHVDQHDDVEIRVGHNE